MCYKSICLNRHDIFHGSLYSNEIRKHWTETESFSACFSFIEMVETKKYETQYVVMWFHAYSMINCLIEIGQRKLTYKCSQISLGMCSRNRKWIAQRPNDEYSCFTFLTCRRIMKLIGIIMF